MRRRTVLVAGLSGLLGGAFPRIGPARAAETAVAVAHRHVAAARHGAGLPALTPMAALDDMAWRQALHMRRVQETTHVAPDGGDPEARARAVRYPGPLLGEVLADTHDGPAETVALWLGHEATREVVLAPGGRHLGLAAATGRGGRTWWSLVVAA